MTRKHLWLRPVGWLPILVLLQVVMTAAPASAQIIDWNNVAGGAYAKASNWNPANVPNTSAETAQFNLAGTFTVTFSASSSTTIDDLLMGDGDVTFRNAGSFVDATLNISDDALINGGDLTLARLGGTADVNLNITALLQVNSGSTFSAREGAAVTAAGLVLGTGGTMNVNTAGTFNSVADITIDGTLNIQTGGAVSNTLNVFIGNTDPNSTGTATVDGVGSTWMNSSNLIVGNLGNGTLNIQNGGEVSNDLFGIVGNGPGSVSTVTVDGVGSTWMNSFDLFVGHLGEGTLNIQNGGAVSSLSGSIGFFLDSTGTVTVDGVGSTWTNSAGLFVGGNAGAAGGTGTLTLLPGGMAQVGGTLKIWDDGTVNLFGGTLKLADTSSIDNATGTFTFGSGVVELQGDSTITPTFLNAVLGGSSLSLGQELHVLGEPTFVTPLAIDGGQFTSNTLSQAVLLQLNSGTLRVTNQAHTIEPLGPLGDTLNLASNMTIQIDQGLTNNGLVTGDGTIGGNFTNSVIGEVRVSSGQSLDFTGASNTNDGQINVLGGSAVFSGPLTNSATGDILGRGTLRTGGAGLTNEGDLALSNGQTDIFGDVANQTTGRVIISGNADVTFWDDVSDSGTLFNVSTGSSATFFGTAGFGIFGGGDVFFEDDVTPGSSPGLETFGGNVHFGVFSNLQIEIAGTVPGSEFDVLNVLGDVTLSGSLDVTLLNPFSLSPGQSFEIMDIGGSLSGTFLDLAEGGLVGNFGGTNLLITYAGGDGNDVTLLSALPGDFDIDGDVDGFDFLEWQRGGSPNPLSQMDLAAWQANYGMVAPLSATSTGVPEPTTCTLALAALCLAMSRRRAT